MMELIYCRGQTKRQQAAGSAISRGMHVGASSVVYYQTVLNTHLENAVHDHTTQASARLGCTSNHAKQHISLNTTKH
jgi:hypothetical protein